MENVRVRLAWFLLGVDCGWLTWFIWHDMGPRDTILPLGVAVAMLIVEWWARQDAAIQARRDREEWEKLIWG